jgi:hypothetical protein
LAAAILGSKDHPSCYLMDLYPSTNRLSPPCEAGGFLQPPVHSPGIGSGCPAYVDRNQELNEQAFASGISRISSKSFRDVDSRAQLDIRRAFWSISPSCSSKARLKALQVRRAVCPGGPFDPAVSFTNSCEALLRYVILCVLPQENDEGPWIRGACCKRRLSLLHRGSCQLD